MDKKTNEEKKEFKSSKRDRRELDLSSLKELGDLLNLDSSEIVSREKLVNAIMDFVYLDTPIQAPIESEFFRYEDIPITEANQKRRERLAMDFKRSSDVFAFMLKNNADGQKTENGEVMNLNELYDNAGLSNMSFRDSERAVKLSFKNREGIEFPKVEDMARLTGYLDCRLDDWFVVCSRLNKTLAVNDSFVRDYNLEQYDNIEFTFVYEPNKDKYTLVDVVSLNGKTGMGGKGLRRFDKLGILKPKANREKELPETDGWFIKKLYDVAGIHRGERLLVCGGSEGLQDRIVQELGGLFKNASSEVFIVYLGKKSRRELDEAQGNNYITIKKDSSIATQWDELATAFFRAKRVVEAGGDAVVIVNSLEAVYQLVSQVLKKSRIQKKMAIIAEFFEMGSIRDSDGSLSVVYIADKADNFRSDKIKDISTLFVPLKSISKGVYDVDYDHVKSNYFGNGNSVKRKRMRDGGNKETVEENVKPGELRFK